MNKTLVVELKKSVYQVAARFSKPNRVGNVNNETFKVHEIIPTSDHTAIVFFIKDTQKLGMAFFYYINKGMSKGWKYFFPTDSHITGMMASHFYKLECERKNYDKNFIHFPDNNNTEEPIQLAKVEE